MTCAIFSLGSLGSYGGTIPVRLVGSVSSWHGRSLGYSPMVLDPRGPLFADPSDPLGIGDGNSEQYESRGGSRPATLYDWLASLTVTQGRYAGEKMQVLEWQEQFIRGAFAPGVSTAALSVARGNGKTTVLSGVALATVDGPLARPRAETVLVASSFEQARIAFEHIVGFLGSAIQNREKWRVWDTAQQARLENRYTGARIRCIGSDPKRAHGLAPSLVLADEPAQWPPTTSERMIAALQTALGKQVGGRLVALGTRSDSDLHWFSRMLNGGCDYAQVHTADPHADIQARATWLAANPSLDHMPDLELTIESESKRASEDPSLLAQFNALRLNLGVSDSLQATLLDAGTWDRIEGDAPAVGPAYWGIDLGGSAAMSCVSAYWPESGRLEILAAFPTVPDLLTRGRRDGVDNLYEVAHARGEVMLAGNNTVKVHYLIDAALETFGGKPAGIACDRWREAELRDALAESGLPVVPLELRGQGFRDGAEDVRAFQNACLDGDVVPLPNLVLTSAMAEARVALDPAGNAKLAKQSEGGRRSRARDDAAAAAIQAVSLARRRHRPRSSSLLLGVVE